MLIRRAGDGQIRAHQESGFAMPVVMTVVLIISALVGVILMNVHAEWSGLGAQRGEANALRTADGGVSQLVYLIQQGTNWTAMPETYATPSTGEAWASQALGWIDDGNGGRYRAHVDVDPDDASQRIVTMQGEYPTGSGQFATVQATVRRESPEAFEYAVFADKGLDVHHHDSSYITPTVVTPKIHSNGYANIDWSSGIHVDTLSAATSVQLAKGGGKLPNGSAIPAAGYTWAYNLPNGTDATNPNRCFPSKVFPPLDYSATTWNFPSGAVCGSAPKYTGNARVIGDIAANSVHVKARGDTSTYSGTETCSGTTQAGINDPITGACIATRGANIDAGKVILDVTNATWTGPGGGNAITTHYRAGTSPAPCTAGPTCVADCAVCNQGSADAAGSVGGVVNIHPVQWSPGTVPFPSLDFRTKYFPVAKADQGESGVGASGCNSITATIGANTGLVGTTGNTGSTCHIFPTPGSVSFVNYIANPFNVSIPSGLPVGSLYSAANDCTKCLVWLDAARRVLEPTLANRVNVQHVIANGTFFFNAGTNFDLDWASVKTAFGQNTATPTSPAPTIAVRGAVVAEDGDAELKSSITIVGPAMDPFNATAPTSTLPGGAGAIPGLLAIGGKIDVSDYDADADWTDVSLYERYKRNTVTVRGLVYSGTWDAGSQTSTAVDQHWHSYDPKNQETIIGAQVGGKLHDCNSFVFSYDPLVKNLSAFSTGAATPAYVVDWQQIASTP